MQLSMQAKAGAIKPIRHKQCHVSNKPFRKDQTLID